MAEVRSIVLTSTGTMQQAVAGDTQTVSGTLTTASGNLVLNPADDVEVAAGKDLVLAAGAGGADLSAGTGAFKTSTGAVTISGSSVAIDSTGVDDTLTIGANSNNITIGADGKLVTFAGDVQIDGAQTVVGETTFQQNATFEGNTAFGSDPADGDTVSFANATIIGPFTFEAPGYKITNLLDPTAGSQEAATAKYVDDGLDLKVAKAGDTMTGPLTIAGNNDLYIGEAAAPGGSIRIYGAFAQDLLVSPSYGVKSLKNHLLLDATQNPDTSFGGTVKIGSDANTLAVDIGRAGSTLTVKANLSLDSVNKITNLANGSADSDAVNYGQIKDLVSAVSAALPLLSSGGATPEISISTAGAADGNVLTYDSDAGTWGPQAPVLTPPGGAVNDVQLNDGAGGFTGSASLSFVSGTGLTIGAITVPDTDGSAGQVLKTDGSGALSWQDDSSIPAGSDTQIQFNDSNVFGAVAAFTFNKTTTELVVGGGEAHNIKIAPLGASGNPLVESDDSMNINVANFAGALGLQAGGNDLVLIGGDDGGGMSYLQTQAGVRLETKGEFWMAETATLPTGVASTGKLAVKSDGDGVLFFVDSAGQAHYAMPDGLNSLGSVSGNVTLDFDPAKPAYRTLTVGGALTFQTPSSNLAAGRGMSLRLDNSAGSLAGLAFPNDWTWLAGSKPVQIEAGKVGIISLVAYGAADTDIVAAWSYSDSVGITGGGTAGQVAYFDGTRTIKSEGGLAWDETNDRLNIGNADNGAHSANLRVGGSAHIGGEVFLDGNVDLGDAAADAITVNGAMSLASGASFDGTAGTVDLPAQFSIDGSAVSADVTAANLNTLTGGSDASSLHTHSGAGAVIVALNTAANSLVAGDVVCADSVALQVKKADADASQASARVLGVVESAGKVMLSGLASAKFKSGLTVALGEPVYLSLDAGLLTNVAPNTGAISEVGIIVSTADYAGATKCIVALQVKAPIFLS